MIDLKNMPEAERVRRRTRAIEGRDELHRAASPKAPGTCAWFLLCENPATTTMPHPILGDVPCCQRCADKVERLSR
jgi:hypothetical protein